MPRQLSDVSPVLRGAALLPAAALGVHELRYRLAFGADAPDVLAVQGHAYLTALAPWLVLLAALALGAALGRLARPAHAPRPRRAGLRTWLAATAALLAIYAGQELLEGALAASHAGGLAGVLGDGGWWALPAALLAGGALALGLRGADAPLPAATTPARPPAPATPLTLLAVEPFVLRPRPLARAAAGRAPPHAA